MGIRGVKFIMFVVGATVALLIVYGPVQWFADSTTSQSLSPDERYRVYLVESKPNLPLRIDRNVKLYLATLDDYKHEIERADLFVSPDEGRPIGSERFLWSRDSAYLLLVGKHFFVATDLPIADGEQAYFLYHVPSKRSWCNSRQATGKNGALTDDQLRGIDFMQPVTLQ